MGKKTFGWGRPQVRYEQAFNQTFSFKYHWSQGDIAFLKPEDAFSAEEYKALIKPAPGHLHGYLPAKATGHPVIILSSPTENSTHVLVTPVSAYSSSEDNNFLPPWKQDPHKWKSKDDFRSFHGCERYSTEYPYLYLEDGKSMPKPRASWLYIQSLWAVPLSVIGRFTKTKDLLRVRRDSLDNLLGQMRIKCRRWKECKAELDAYERAANGVVDLSPAGQVCWRDAPPPTSAATPIPRRPSFIQPHQHAAPSSGPPQRPSPSPSLSPSWASIAAQKKTTAASGAAKSTAPSARQNMDHVRNDNNTRGQFRSNQAGHPVAWGNNTTTAHTLKSWRNVAAATARVC